MSTWRSLARSGGVAMAVLLAVAAVGLRDLEAAAIAVAVLAAALLVGWRKGLLGLAALALLSANVAFWMGAGALSNLAHGEGFWVTALPSTLTVASLVALTASVSAIASRHRRPGPGGGQRVVVGAAVLVAAAALVVGAVGVGTAQVSRAGDVEMVAESVRFVPDDVVVGAGRVAIVVTNRDLFWHTFTINELDVDVRTPVGATRRVAFDAPPGVYEFVCDIPGHTQAGMKGTLTVR